MIERDRRRSHWLLANRASGMKASSPVAGSWLLVIGLTCSSLTPPGFSQSPPRESLAGEKAAEALKKQIAAEEYNLQYGPLRFQTEARLGGGYTDNIFYSDKNRQSDWLVKPEVTLRAWWPVSQLNILRLSL